MGDPAMPTVAATPASSITRSATTASTPLRWIASRTRVIANHRCGQPETVSTSIRTTATVRLPSAGRSSVVLIGELATPQACRPKTIRYYETIGLVDPPQRTTSGYNNVDATAADRLGFSRAAQAAGLTLGEVRPSVQHQTEEASRSGSGFSGKFAQMNASIWC